MVVILLRHKDMRELRYGKYKLAIPIYHSTWEAIVDMFLPEKLWLLTLSNGASPLSQYRVEQGP